MFDSAIQGRMPPKNVDVRPLANCAGRSNTEQGKAGFRRRSQDFKQGARDRLRRTLDVYFSARNCTRVEKPRPETGDSKDMEDGDARRAPDPAGDTRHDYAWTLATNPKDSVRDGTKRERVPRRGVPHERLQARATIEYAGVRAVTREPGDWEDCGESGQQEAIHARGDRRVPEDVKGIEGSGSSYYKGKKPVSRTAEGGEERRSRRNVQHPTPQTLNI
jgi:hypothetical protein